MTIDDESLLSAYMDGQLSPDHQQWVESAVIADPRLGEELRKLSLVRDLVAGLSHEASVDVSSAVLRRLHGRSRLRMIWSTMPVRAPSLPGPGWAAGLLGVAAMLLIGLLLTFSHVVRSLAVQGPAPQAGRIVASVETSISRSSAGKLKASESLWPSFAPHKISEGASSKSESENRYRDDHDRSARESGGLEHVSQYLDNPDLRRIFLVANVRDGATQKQVASVVEETTRFNYFKITIAQGIVIDPRHPGEATVFALVVSPTELDTLRNRLRTALQNQVEEAPVDPAVVTQLADIGQVQACPPVPAAVVQIPRVALAIKAANPGGNDEPAPPVDHAALDRLPTPEQERSSPAADLARPTPEQTFIVLVWVSRTRQG
jgi:anti-sigma factor RsiW